MFLNIIDHRQSPTEFHLFK